MKHGTTILYIEAQEYVALNIEDIARINEQWSSISEHVQLGDLDNAPLIDAAKTSLAQEQDASVRSLLEQAEDVPYEEIAVYLKECETAVQTLRERIQRCRTESSLRKERLLSQRVLLETIAPTTKNALDKVVQQETDKIVDQDIRLLEMDLEHAEAELERAESLFATIGEAWPVPALTAVTYEPAENEIFTIDQFPNEREQISDSIASKVIRKFESRLSDASTYLALLLKEKHGHIWTGEELGDLIYDDGSSERRNSSRISALISNYRNGSVPVLAEEFGEDLVLQRGKRQLFDAHTGNRIPNTIKVVWRLVDTDTATNAQVITTLNSNRTVRQSYGDWEPATKEGINQQMLGVRNKREALPIEISNQPEEDETVKDSGESKQSHETRADWREEFVKNVHTTIETYKEYGLMNEQTTSWKEIRRKAPSTIAGTEQARDRSLKNKIIKRAEAADDAIITIEQAILTAVQNSHPNIFRVSSRRKQAVEIVHEIVEGYFRQHSEN